MAMIEKSRTHNAINNTLFGIAAAAVNVVLNLVVRVVIVDYLGDQINGLHSLFLSTISVLALVQMGFSTAMIIHLYKPVHNSEELIICQLLNFYKNIYRKVAWLFLGLGVLLCIFLMPYLVTTTINMWAVRGYFMLFILSYFFNYRTYYKRSLLFAEQKNRISILATMVSELLFRGLAIVFVIIFKQYYLFLIMLICDYSFSNWLCAKYVDRHHLYINKYTEVYLPEEKRSEIIRTIKPLMVNQISDTVQKAAQSILISILLGNVAIVGYYGSYQLVTSTIQLVMAQLGGAFTSGFGNLNAEDDKIRLANAFLKFFFVVSFVSILLCTTAICCIQDIILFLFGPNFILTLSNVGLIFFILFIGLICVPIISVQNALGLHRLDAKWMIVQAITAVTLGYIGGLYYNMNGILVGLIIPMTVFSLIVKGHIIINNVFSSTHIHYFRNIAILIVRLLIVLSLTFFIINLINFESAFLAAIVKGICAFVISFFLLCIVYCTNNNLKFYLKRTLQKIIRIS